MQRLPVQSCYMQWLHEILKDQGATLLTTPVILWGDPCPHSGCQVPAVTALLQKTRWREEQTKGTSLPFKQIWQGSHTQLQVTAQRSEVANMTVPACRGGWESLLAGQEIKKLSPKRKGRMDIGRQPAISATVNLLFCKIRINIFAYLSRWFVVGTKWYSEANSS